MDASDLAKRRLKAILDQLAGALSVEEACERIGVQDSVFFELRAAVLQSAASRLEPGRRGRPSKEPTEVEQRLEALEDEMQMTKIELQAARLREEIAVTMPHLYRRRAAKKKT